MKKFKNLMVTLFLLLSMASAQGMLLKSNFEYVMDKSNILYEQIVKPYSSPYEHEIES